MDVRVSQLFAGQQTTVLGGDVDVGSLAYDSRHVQAGGLFAALVGAHSDGHEHIAAAVARGAACVLCERPVDCAPATRVCVPDSRLALARAAQRWYGDPAARLRMVGVTGTNGKTTTVHLVQAVLEAAGYGCGTVGTLGAAYAGRTQQTGLTTPESVDLTAMLAAMVDADVAAVAMEVSSHALDQDRVAGVSFDVGVFTNLTHDHLDYHGSLDAYFAAKAKLVRERLKAGGVAVLNVDDARVAPLATELPRVIGFSAAGAPAAVRCAALELDADGLHMRVETPRGERSVHSPLIGRFNADNLLAAMAVAEALELDPDAVARGIAGLVAVPGRLQRVSRSGEPLVLVDYAHTPDALDKALQAVRQVTRGRLLCVFGCGGDRDAQKRGPMGQVAARLADFSLLTNDNPRSEDPEAIAAAVRTGLEAAGAVQRPGPQPAGSAHAYDVALAREEAIARAVAALGADDALLIAGKGHETYQILGSVRRDFDDRRHARAALDARSEGAPEKHASEGVSDE